MKTLVAALAIELLLAVPASACPTCGGEVRRQVWAGVFDAGFGANLLVTAAPFVILLGLAAAIHGSGPERVATRQGADRTEEP